METLTGALPDLRVFHDQGLNVPLTLTLSHRERGPNVPQLAPAF